MKNSKPQKHTQKEWCRQRSYEKGLTCHNEINDDWKCHAWILLANAPSSVDSPPAHSGSSAWVSLGFFRAASKWSPGILYENAVSKVFTLFRFNFLLGFFGRSPLIPLSLYLSSTHFRVSLLYGRLKQTSLQSPFAAQKRIASLMLVQEKVIWICAFPFNFVWMPNWELLNFLMF